MNKSQLYFLNKKSIKLKAAIGECKTNTAAFIIISAENTNTCETLLKTIGSLVPFQSFESEMQAMHNSYVESPLLLMEYLYIQPNYSHKGTLKLCLATRKRYDDEL